MFVALSSFEVENGMEELVKQAFIDRPDVLCPITNPAEIWLLTYWVDELSFKIWHKTHLKDSHQGIPKGLKLVPHSFKLRYFNTVTT
jgi:hypothetical protein